ncbi:MAG: hypothetical protein LIP08_04285 [Bacteroides sp.]|nr:hypothetical protein [Bacteroides sp.]
MKIRMLLLGMLSSLFFVACDKNDDTPVNPGEDQETKSIFLRFEAGNVAQTRSAENNAGGTKATLSSALIYFVGAEADPKVYAVRTVGGAGSDATIEEITREGGKEFKGIPVDVKVVYVVGNHDSADQAGAYAAFPTAKGTPLSDIEATLLNIQQVNYSSYASQNDGLAALLYGNGNVNTRQNQSQETEHYAHVRVAPVNARIELDELAYTGKLTSFTLDGIFINNYYSVADLGLGDFAPTHLVNNGSDTDTYKIGGNEFAYTYYSTMFDEVGQVVTVTEEKANMKPVAGSTWAYQVFGQAPQVAHIIVKFTDVVDTNGKNQADQYLTVKGFRDMSGNELSTLESGKVYRMKTLAFDDSHLEIIPEPDMISIWVTVEVLDWVEVEVKPIV